MSTTASAMTSALNAPTQVSRITSLRCAACRAASWAASSAAFLRGLLRSLFLGLPLELGLPASSASFLCGFAARRQAALFCLFGLRLLFGEAGFFGFLFGLLAFSLHLLVKIGFQQHGQLSAYHRACALSVSIRHVHIAARPVGQAARIHGQQKRPLGPDDADVVSPRPHSFRICARWAFHPRRDTS